MDFIQHTINWCKGEIFEGSMVALYGAVIVIVSILFRKIGTTPFAKAMFIPLLVVGLLCIIVGGSMVVNNNKRIVEYRKAFEMNPQEFIKSEKERTDNFIKWYPYTMYITAVVIIIAIVCYLFWGGAWGRALGLSLLLLGLSVLFVDNFSEERAGIYHQAIVNKLEMK
jgi:hypothetical protein